MTSINEALLYYVKLYTLCTKEYRCADNMSAVSFVVT